MKLVIILTRERKKSENELCWKNFCCKSLTEVLPSVSKDNNSLPERLTTRTLNFSTILPNLKEEKRKGNDNRKGGEMGILVFQMTTNKMVVFIYNYQIHYLQKLSLLWLQLVRLQHDICTFLP